MHIVSHPCECDIDIDIPLVRFTDSVIRYAGYPDGYTRKDILVLIYRDNIYDWLKIRFIFTINI